MYFIQVLPEQVNARMAILAGKVLAHLPNYLPLYDNPPTSLNSEHQVFAVYPKDDDVLRRMDGGVEKVYLWRGDKNRRDNELDLVSVPILPVDVARGIPAPTSADTARAAFAAFPEPVRLAGVIATVSPEMITALPKATADLKAWAESTLAQSVGA